jgi:transposase-like protein
MAIRYAKEQKERAVKMVLSHLDEYDSVYKAASAIGPKLGISVESLRRWVIVAQEQASPAGEAARVETARVKELERKVRDLTEANEILKAASIFFAGELDPRQRSR